MKRFGAFMLAFKLFTGMNPNWVYVDNGKIRYLFEKKGNRLTQGGITISSYNLPYTDSVVVGVEGKEHTYRGEISIYVDPSGSLNIINRVRLEDAVKSVISTIPVGERNGELLKLKSIMARTMLLYLARTKRIVPDSTDFFVYTGRDGESPLGNFASKFTIGAFLTEDDSLIVPFYHINSGGITESGDDVDCPYDYLISKIDTFARFGKNFEWKRVITRDSLFRVLATKVLEPFEFTSSGRVSSFITDSDRVIPADTVKNILKLPSLLIYTEESKDTIYIYGRGKGTGLGISLESADYMTSSGMSYEDVIRFFYGGKVNITRRFTNEELYRIPLVQYSQKAGTCSHYR